MNNNTERNTPVSAVFWKLLDNFGVQFVNLVVQIVLARLLVPSDYAVVALTSVFVTIAYIFVQTGFSTSLVQRHTLNHLQINSVFLSIQFISISLYLLIFLLSPTVAKFYNMPIITDVLRVQGLMIIIGGLSSVHNSLLTRNLDFKKIYVYKLLGTVAQSVVGIGLAYYGYGVWALVISSLINSIISSISLLIVVKWRPTLDFSIDVIRELSSFSIKILLMQLINTIYDNIKALVIGKEFKPEILGYYNRGTQIPTLLMVNTDGAISTVVFPVLSKHQEDEVSFLEIYRKSLSASVYVIFPLMIGLAAIAEPFTLLILSEKWLPSVPFMVMFSFTCLTWPFSIRFHALNALGKSNLSMILNLIEKLAGVIVAFITLRYGLYQFIIGFAVVSLFSVFLGSIVMKKEIGYQYRDQFGDVFSPLMMSVLMGVVVFSSVNLFNSITLRLIAPIAIGIVFYVTLSVVTKNKTFAYFASIVMNFFNKAN